MISSDTKEVIDKFIPVFESEPSIERVLLFGSRARGDHKYNSDIDIAIDGDNVPEAIYTYLREIAGLYKVDIIDLRSLDNPYLIPEIKKEGIVIYAKK